jgi:NTE family protein
MTSDEASPRIGLVLGAGGVLGGAWLVGALRALATECEWDPASANHFVGTSVGALVAALLASGISPSSDLLHAATFHLLSPLRPLPGSLALARAGLTGSTARPLLATAAGLLPRGVVSTAPIKEVVRRRAGERWPTRRKLWIVACDYRTGRRTVFGRADGERVGLPSAVAASCAIPGFYQPERIGLHEYVDGGLWSTSNLDLLAGQRLDLVICLNPMSAEWPPRHRPAGTMFAHAQRAEHQRALHEVSLLEQTGTPVVLIEPTPADLALMGRNLMRRRHSEEVVDLAKRTTVAQLHTLEKGGQLPSLVGVPSRPAASAYR